MSINCLLLTMPNTLVGRENKKCKNTIDQPWYGYTPFLFISKNQLKKVDVFDPYF